MLRIRSAIVAAAALGFLPLIAVFAATPTEERSTHMQYEAKGAFDVQVVPVAQTEHAGGTKLGRFSIAKTFHGDLAGTGTGEMLTAGTAVPGSAGYVAIELVEATLARRKGTFVLQHSGTMARGGQNLAIAVVPDSGTGDLAGIAGSLTIEIEGKAHFYRLEYSLP